MAAYFASSTNATTPAQQNLTSSSQTIISITSQTAASGITLSRAWIFDFEVGPSGPPNATDCVIVWDIVAITSIGTGTAGVVTTLDQADAATSHVSTINNTADGTTTANSRRWDAGLNQRATYRWQVNPGSIGELVVPATNAAGLAIRAKSATYTSTAIGSIYFRE